MNRQLFDVMMLWNVAGCGKDGTATPARTGDPQIHNLVL